MAEQIRFPTLRSAPALTLALLCLTLVVPAQARAQEPLLSLDRAVYPAGAELVATYATDRPSDTNWVGIYTDPGDAPVDGVFVGASEVWDYAPGTSGSVAISLRGLEPGNYVAYYLYNDGYESLAEPVTFVIEPGDDPPGEPGEPRFELDRSVYAPGDDIVVAYGTDQPARLNWIGVWPEPGGGPFDEAWHGASTTWEYAPGGSGTVRISTDGLAPGAYTAYYLYDDGYTWLREPITFRIMTATETPPRLLTPSLRLRNGQEGRRYSAEVGGWAVDPDGGPVTFSLVRGPSWVRLQRDGTLLGRPNREGTVNVRIRATDVEGLSTTGTVEIRIRDEDEPLVNRLTVVAFNTWLAASVVNDGLNKQVSFLMRSGADVVGLQESRGVVARNLATQLGWYHHETDDSSIISKYPIVETYGGALGGLAGGARIDVGGAVDREVVLWSLHLSAYPYGPYEACLERSSVERVLEIEHESGRVSQINRILAAIDGQIADAQTGGAPIFLVGDFNAPSHLDWVPSTADTHCGYVIDWPTSVLTADAGLIDTYREVHPNPRRSPGNTWSPVYDFNDAAGTVPEPQDRIDFVHAAGDLEVISSEAVVVGDPQTVPDHLDNEWASDHAAVVTVVRLR